MSTHTPAQDLRCADEFERWFAAQVAEGKTPSLSDAFMAGWYAFVGKQPQKPKT